MRRVGVGGLCWVINGAPTAAEATGEADPCLSLSFLVLFFFSLPLFLSVLASMSPVSLGPISIPRPT